VSQIFILQPHFPFLAAATDGGGKLVLTGGADTLGSSGAISLAETVMYSPMLSVFFEHSGNIF
jgi:hypothetical protein